MKTENARKFQKFFSELPDLADEVSTVLLAKRSNSELPESGHNLIEPHHLRRKVTLVEFPKSSLTEKISGHLVWVCYYVSAEYSQVLSWLTASCMI